MAAFPFPVGRSTPTERLASLIEEEVNSGQIRLKEARLKDVKQICRTSDDLVHEAFRLIRKYLEEEHAEVRWSAFLIAKELFSRSHYFRELLIEDINDYLILTAEIDPRRPLPLPKPAAVRLKDAARITLKEWAAKYGGSYKKLSITSKFLEDTHKIDVASTNAAPIGASDHDSSASSLSKPVRRELDQRKIDNVKEEIAENIEELRVLMQEIENLFQIVVPDFTEDTPGDTSDASDMRVHGMPSTSYSLQVSLQPVSLKLRKNAENDSIVEKIQENVSLLNGKFLPLVLRWLSVLSKSGADSQDLRLCIDLKQNLESILRKAATLGIEFIKPAKRKKADSDDDDDFEEVEEKEGMELVIPPNKRKEYGLEMVSQNMQNGSGPGLSNANSVGFPKVDVTSSKRDAHLSVAPVLAFGPDLERWELNSDKLPEIPQLVQFDSCHRFWTSMETEKNAPNQEIAGALLTRTIPYVGKFEPVKWFCRAPLPNGQLCSRQDRLRCPFHGRILARDVNGVPVNEEERRREDEAKLRAQTERVPDWQDPDLLRDLEAATGKNLKVEKKKRRKHKMNSLTDVEKMDDTPRKRLAKKVMNPSVVKRVSAQMDEIQRKSAAENFQHNWNYSLSS